ncbi:uncharacterized protein CCR75_005982 [Bremia lactucae]|uniref:RING-type domain-containing protein n=1 Tax=Bremia lactucae TaxID=4779 RepID=A0A976FR19_BRELC|nr:hypothetical protein CCR75_005982 [Bremia lactucae]
MGVKLAELSEHLGCAICHGILRDAHTIRDCLHSFCKSCIYRYFLVKGSRICPKCKKLLSPRPIASLIMDQKLQQVVDHIFPDFQEQEVLLEKEFYAKNNFKLKTEHLDGGNVSILVPKNPSRRNLRSSTLATKSPSGNLEDNIVCTKQLTIEVYPQQTTADAVPMLKFPFMEVDGALKMLELCMLVKKRLKLPNNVHLEMACMGTTMGPELSVYFIQRTIWQHKNPKVPLVLHYRRAKNSLYELFSLIEKVGV